MFESTVLELITGVVACFASVSLMTSSLYEGIASCLNLRAKSLLAGICQLLNEAAPTKSPPAPAVGAPQGLVLNLYNQALVHPRGEGTAKSLADLVNLPSYIDPKHFAAALADFIGVADSAEQLKTNIRAKVPDAQLQTMLLGMVDRCGSSVDQFRAEVSAWFDNGMARVSGAYKRDAQAWSFGIALLIAVFFNIDAFHLFSTLWHHPVSAAQLSVLAQAGGGQAASLDAIRALPIGWSDAVLHESTLAWLQRIVGWFVTASSSLFGAPFWFDLLNRFTQIKGTGMDPSKQRTARA